MLRATLVVMALVLVPVIGLGTLKGLSYEARSTAGDGPQVPKETTAELLEAAVRGCAAAGGQASTGIQDGVVIARCTPSALPHLGTQPVVRRRPAP